MNLETGHSNLALMVMSGSRQGKCVGLDTPLLLGRDPRSRLFFSDERISRHHALIDLVEGQAVIQDLGSKNGTFVNGREITDSYTLRLNDRIRLGKTVLAVVPREDTQSGPPSKENIETRADHMEAGLEKMTEELQISRGILREATELSARMAALSKTRQALPAIITVIRKAFQSDCVGIFRPGGVREAIHAEGALTLAEDEEARLADYLSQRPMKSRLFPSRNPDGTSDRPFPDTLLAFPLWVDEERCCPVVMRRNESRPFRPENVGLADTLIECLRALPLQDVLLEGGPKALADNLGIIGSSELLGKVRKSIRTYAPTEMTVLIRGESGTGKELCARALGQLSNRRFGPFVEMNCACMMPELIEAELFGHEKGAFTGAASRRLGKLEIADGGTLFLDEIGEIPKDLQAKLLRVLEGQPFYRLGGNELIRSDVRFICATNRNLEYMAEEGRFRQDLFHRINVLSIEMPPLREHLEDIPELAPYLLSQIREGLPRSREYTITPKAYRRLLSHSWPGNVRELANVLQRTVVLSTGNVIDEGMLPPDIGDDAVSSTLQLPRLQFLTEVLEREEISRALTECNGQKSQAARLLGISRPTLDKKIKVYNLQSLVAARTQRAK